MTRVLGMLPPRGRLIWLHPGVVTTVGGTWRVNKQVETLLGMCFLVSVCVYFSLLLCLFNQNKLLFKDLFYLKANGTEGKRSSIHGSLPRWPHQPGLGPPEPTTPSVCLQVAGRGPSTWDIFLPSQADQQGAAWEEGQLRLKPALQCRMQASQAPALPTVLQQQP